VFHHIRPRDKTNVGRPDIGQSIRRNKTDVGHSRKDQNRSPIPAISSPRPMEPIKRRYQTGFRLRGKSPSNRVPPIARFLPPYPAKTSLHEKIFAGHRHFSKANRRFLSAVLEKILSGITGKLQTTKRHGR